MLFFSAEVLPVLDGIVFFNRLGGVIVENEVVGKRYNVATVQMKLAHY